MNVGVWLGTGGEVGEGEGSGVSEGARVGEAEGRGVFAGALVAANVPVGGLPWQASERQASPIKRKGRKMRRKLIPKLVALSIQKKCAARNILLMPLMYASAG